MLEGHCLEMHIVTAYKLLKEHSHCFLKQMLDFYSHTHIHIKPTYTVLLKSKMQYILMRAPKGIYTKGWFLHSLQERMRLAWPQQAPRWVGLNQARTGRHSPKKDILQNTCMYLLLTRSTYPLQVRLINWRRKNSVPEILVFKSKEY